MKAIKRPGQMYPLGILFGLGFDTATEISLLVLAGAGAATGLPWYAVLVLPLLFAAGMSLFDTLDGAFMQAAYQWAFIKPVRKVYYNLTTTGLSVAVALLIGGIEMITVLHNKASLTDPITSWIATITLDDIGYLIVALFLLVWAGSFLYWRISNIEAPLDQQTRHRQHQPTLTGGKVRHSREWVKRVPTAKRPPPVCAGGGRWPGPGSNRRPSTFQADARTD